MSTRLNWNRAKAPRPTAHKSVIWANDSLAKRARHELAKWKVKLPRRQRRRLEAAL